MAEPVPKLIKTVSPTSQKSFADTIQTILLEHFGKDANAVFNQSPLLQYIQLKTKAANRGSKSRGNFANLYAVYVLVEDYISKGFLKGGDYSKYEGAIFSQLFKRQRELPFGSKLENHGFNSRMNDEFKKYFPTGEFIPIMRDLVKLRYWINTNLLLVRVGKKSYNIAPTIIACIDAYMNAKKASFQLFIETCNKFKNVVKAKPEEVETFIIELLAPNVDARLFEIVSFSILKYFYHDKFVYFGYSMDAIKKENLKLFKTGRTNANDGGIDFVMQPLGRFFQVTETLDVKKYFLDIDKLERFPVSFVIKSEETISDLKRMLEQGAKQLYAVDAIVTSYMDCIEEIINVPRLRECFALAVAQKYLPSIMDEIVKQSKVEFNYTEETGAEVDVEAVPDDELV